MVEYFHCAPIRLGVGSIIEAGNWGRLIKRYTRPGNLHGYGEPWVLNRELIFETIRQQAFSAKPSRLSSSFSLLSHDDAVAYRAQHDPFLLSVIHKVELVDPDEIQHIGSMDLLIIASPGQPFLDTTRFNAQQYFQGVGQGIKEIVSVSALRVLETLD